MITCESIRPIPRIVEDIVNIGDGAKEVLTEKRASERACVRAYVYVYVYVYEYEHEHEHEQVLGWEGDLALSARRIYFGGSGAAGGRAAADR